MKTARPNESVAIATQNTGGVFETALHDGWLECVISLLFPLISTLSLFQLCCTICFKVNKVSFSEQIISIFVRLMFLPSTTIVRCDIDLQIRQRSIGTLMDSWWNRRTSSYRKDVRTLMKKAKIVRRVVLYSRDRTSSLKKMRHVLFFLYRAKSVPRILLFRSLYNAPPKLNFPHYRKKFQHEPPPEGFPKDVEVGLDGCPHVVFITSTQSNDDRG